jgi:hypothetical protein
MMIWPSMIPSFSDHLAPIVAVPLLRATTPSFFVVPLFSVMKTAASRLPHTLDSEIGRNAVFKGVLSLAPPHWLYHPDNIPLDHAASSVIAAFYDRILKLRNLVAMFGSFVMVRPFVNHPSFSQCTCCLRLGHSVDCCNRPSSLVVCPHCRGPHSASEHAFRCPNASKHCGRQCNCPPSCFLC